MEVAMTSVLKSHEESKRETGTSLIFIGLAIWVADALVAFLFPAAVKIGRQGMFLSVILVLAVMGLALMATGYMLRGKPEE
jgi:NADH:ubiquinone oxidoreductase subunit 3 (subunit A)